MMLIFFYFRLALLWYHTIVRPFYALDGSNVQAGVAMASQLIEETGDDYQHSALFQFFRGRVHRLNVSFYYKNTNTDM